ncbi:Sedlin [Aureobasidium pullulans]|nr:Sedlin [Aureobasidium pullulans]THX09560.1 Sedlin [Aureobasidium pullulans]
MATIKTPAIACVGVIGRQNNPLHISIFPAEGDKEERSKLDFSFMLSTCLDIFEARLPEKNVGQDFGLLQAIDERLAMYGWLTNTGVKLVIIVDMEGRQSPANDSRTPPVLGLKNSDLTPAFHALQKAYINLLRNPFYTPEDHSPNNANAHQPATSTQITSRKFINEVNRIGRVWAPAVASR